jgi:hypothetical protein
LGQSLAGISRWNNEALPAKLIELLSIVNRASPVRAGEVQVHLRLPRLGLAQTSLAQVLIG